MYMVQNRKNDFGIVKTVMFLCIMAILCSCKDTKKILTRNSYQYWHYIDSKQNEDETRHPYFCREDSFYFMSIAKVFLSSFEQIGVLGNIMVFLFLIIFMNQVGIY